MRVEFSNGYVLELTYLPDRVKPVLGISKDGRFVAHAVVSGDGYGEFVEFFKSIWGEPR